MTNETLIQSAARRLIRLAPTVVDRLRFLRGPGESYSDVIVWLVAAGDGIEGA